MKETVKKETDLIIRFPNPEAAEHFASWLSGSGEQEYWQWMEYREDEVEEGEEKDITVTFHYHGEEDESKATNDPARYKEFLCDNIIRTTVYHRRRD